MQFKSSPVAIVTLSLSEQEASGIKMASSKECSFWQLLPDNWKCHPEHHDHIDSYRRLLRQDIKRLKPWTTFSEKDQTFSVHYLFFFALFLFKPEVNSATAHICRPVLSSKSLNNSKPVKTKLAIWMVILFSLTVWLFLENLAPKPRLQTEILPGSKSSWRLQDRGKSWSLLLKI